MEIMYKAKRYDKGDWIFGFPVKVCGGWQMHTYNSNVECRVIDNTICRYSGMYDMNGVDLFEYDNVKSNHSEDIVSIIKYVEVDGCWGIFNSLFEKLEDGYLRLTEKNIKEFNITSVGNKFDLYKKERQ